MIAFFDQVIAFFKIIIDFVITAIEAIVMILTQIPVWMSFLTTMFGYMPPVLVSFMLLGVTLSIVFMILRVF